MAEWSRELGAKIHLAQLSPARDDAVAFDRAVIYETQLALDNVIGTTARIVSIAAIGAAVEVEHDGLWLPIGESVAMNTCAGGSGQFHFNTTLLQIDHIVTRTCRFGLVSEVLAEVCGLQLFRRHIGADGHQADVNEVGTACATEVRMRETIYFVFVVVVATARIPSDHLLGLRAELYHTLRHRGTWEGASAESTGFVSLRTDKRVDIDGVIRHF